MQNSKPLIISVLIAAVVKGGPEFVPLKKLGDVGVYYIQPQATCSEVKEIQDLQTSLFTSLQKSLLTAELVK